MDDDELIKLSKEALTAQNGQLKNIIANQGDKNTIVKQQNKPYNFEKSTFRHVLIKFLYLGWNYNDYTVPEDTNETVENYLFKALIKTFNQIWKRIKLLQTWWNSQRCQLIYPGI